MKKFIICLLLFLISVSASAKGADGYDFLKKEYSHMNVVVQVIEYDSITDLNNAFRKSNIKVKVPKNVVITGFTIKSPKTNICIINILNPEIFYGPEYYGHELMHCIHGDFHVKFSQ